MRIMQNLFFMFFVNGILLVSCSCFAWPFAHDDLFSSYKDAELEDLWGSIPDIYHPKYADYLKIEEYLSTAYRPYLDVIINFGIQVGLLPQKNINRHLVWHNRLLQNIHFVSEKKKEAIQKIINLNTSKEDKSKCIYLYASQNIDSFDQKSLYSQRLMQIIEDLKRVGYKGHIIYRIGGYPAEQFGGLRLAHVPYSFKVLGLIEASLLGYEQVLWLDCSLHPLNNLSKIFEQMKRKGVFLLHNGVNLAYDYEIGILPNETVSSWSLNLEDLSSVNHICAGVVGVSFNSKIGHEFINEWYRLTSLVIPAMSLYPEEALISAAAFRTDTMSTGHVGNYLDASSHSIDTADITKSFLFDKSLK